MIQRHNLFVTGLLVALVAFPAFAQTEDSPSGDSLSGDSPSASEKEYRLTGENDSSQESPLPVDVVEAIWKVIDADENGRTSDVEIYEALRRARVFANHKTRTPARDYAIEHYDADADGLLSREEAVPLLAAVRRERDEVAARAIAYWQSLDTSDNDAVEAAEIKKVLDRLDAVGEALTGPLDGVLARMDLDGNRALDRDEASFSANGLLRVELATRGPGIAGRRPKDWMQIVSGVSALDADADNRLSMREAASVRTLARAFKKIDRNSDSQLTAGELCDYRESVRAALASVSRSSSGGICGG